MSKIVIIEGARGVGKSTVVGNLRKTMTNTISINMTGNNEDSYEAKMETMYRYLNWLELIKAEKDSSMTYIFDRFFFSEIVYSKLYKSYDFSEHYGQLFSLLDEIAESVEVIVIELSTGLVDFSRNLNRGEKADLFNNENLRDNTEFSHEQQVEYCRVFVDAEGKAENIKFRQVSCTGKSEEEVMNEVKELIG